jgi:phosphate/sulfate permease
VRWQVGYELLAAWIVTIPVNALRAALLLIPL